MTLTDRINRTDAQRHLPDNVVPMERVERRQIARWREIQMEQKTGKDLTGYIGGGDAA